jgi:hypothetical protein
METITPREFQEGEPLCRVHILAITPVGEIIHVKPTASVQPKKDPTGGTTEIVLEHDHDGEFSVSLMCKDGEFTTFKTKTESMTQEIGSEWFRVFRLLDCDCDDDNELKDRILHGSLGVFKDWVDEHKMELKQIASKLQVKDFMTIARLRAGVSVLEAKEEELLAQLKHRATSVLGHLSDGT